ncbi:peptidoglycan-associated lipoprotein Pal [Aliikangiella marina]|uniref:Peptidoglycan-associated lipoprotein n=1 Tax=Aliikangiella marina TaxID=1712262 RepID=A0A545TD54_9GAMM|nr:peptidoglycan-associated lipoprotein Pal [Aliikangiella marina]TQV75106.1 peptidoglycan-associated lipoprotein Pal [Aliikangiella marina]
MSINKLGKGLVVLASATFLFACAGSDDSSSQDTVPVVQEPTQPTVVTPPPKSPEELAKEANDAARQARTVYFDFDDDTVKAEGRTLLEAHAWFLSKPENAGVVVEVQGHCDERGTPAYNLALGERRAKAVAQILMLNGVQASQIKTVSHGEEKPANPGHDEAAWEENRRGVLVYEG